MILFDTTESVIDILWDVALAFFIVRLALFYFLLSMLSPSPFFSFSLPKLLLLTQKTDFISATILSYLTFTNHVLITPVTHLIATLPSSHQFLIPFLLVSAAIWARVLVVRYEIPRSGWFRLAIGGVALGLMVLVEGILGAMVYEWQEDVWERVVDGTGWMAIGGWLGWYALMPWAEMVFERGEGVEEEVVVREKK